MWFFVFLCDDGVIEYWCVFDLFLLFEFLFFVVNDMWVLFVCVFVFKLIGGWVEILLLECLGVFGVFEMWIVFVCGIKLLCVGMMFEVVFGFLIEVCVFVMR